MQSLFINQKIKYDGTQLKPLFTYMEHGLLGDSVVSWIGSCDISFDKMVDGEDVRAQAEIKGSEMLHFIFEMFDPGLLVGVFVQRLFASVAKDFLNETLGVNYSLVRNGDDLYWNQKKLSISIATKSVTSTLVHFALNISNAGTPVATCALKDDFKIDAHEFAQELMKRFTSEYQDIKNATMKVRSV